MPLYEYEHMLGWATVKRHEAEEITLLCDQHHREATSGLLPAEDVRKANLDPFNLRSGVSRPYDLHYSGDRCETLLGSSVSFAFQPKSFPAETVSVAIDATPLLGFTLDEGHLFLHLQVFDEMNERVLSIVENQLVYSVAPWDITLVGRNLVIRSAPGEILVDIKFDTPNRIVVQRGRFLLNGAELLLTPDYVLLTNHARLISEVHVEGPRFGLVVGAGNIGGGAAVPMPEVSRYGFDRAAAIRWAEKSVKPVTDEIRPETNSPKISGY